MRSLSELAGLDLLWKVQPGSAHLPDQAQRSYVLFNGDEPVIEAQLMWRRLESFDVILEAGEGTYQVHMDLAGPTRETVVWKTGVPQSIAGFRIASETMITATGWITTASGRSLAWAPEHPMGYEYVIFQSGGPRLVTLSAAFSLGVDLGMGGNPGHMLIASEEANDPEMPGLVALNFALTNEQVMLLHRDMESGHGLQGVEAQPEDMAGLLKLLGGKLPGWKP